MRACAVCMQHANRPLYSVCLSGRAGASCFPGVPGLAKGALCMRPCRCRRRPGITKQAVCNDRQCHRKASARSKFHDQDECGWQTSCSGGGVHSGNIQRMLRQWMDGRDAFAGKSWLVFCTSSWHVSILSVSVMPCCFGRVLSTCHTKGTLFL